MAEIWHWQHHRCSLFKIFSRIALIQQQKKKIMNQWLAEETIKACHLQYHDKVIVYKGSDFHSKGHFCTPHQVLIMQRLYKNVPLHMNTFNLAQIWNERHAKLINIWLSIASANTELATFHTLGYWIWNVNIICKENFWKRISITLKSAFSEYNNIG